ncbi:MAG: hypothetical protein ACK4VM_17930 [Bosea sp. (in: a-proteobacteria)]
MEKWVAVEKTSKTVLTPESPFPYTPPIETATPLATPSPPLLPKRRAFVADQIGANLCLSKRPLFEN